MSALAQPAIGVEAHAKRTALHHIPTERRPEAVGQPLAFLLAGRNREAELAIEPTIADEAGQLREGTVACAQGGDVVRQRILAAQLLGCKPVDRGVPSQLDLAQVHRDSQRALPMEPELNQ